MLEDNQRALRNQVEFPTSPQISYREEHRMQGCSRRSGTDSRCMICRAFDELLEASITPSITPAATPAAQVTSIRRRIKSSSSE